VKSSWQCRTTCSTKARGQWWSTDEDGMEAYSSCSLFLSSQLLGEDPQP
jgi:hypothetical protein